MATNAFNNSQPLFAIDPTTGAVTLVQRLQYYYGDGSRYINGVKARGQFTATFRACDAGTPSLCASAAMTMVVVANYSAPLQPVILAYNPSSGFSTQGNEVIQVRLTLHDGTSVMLASCDDTPQPRHNHVCTVLLGTSCSSTAWTSTRRSKSTPPTAARTARTVATPCEAARSTPARR